MDKILYTRMPPSTVVDNKSTAPWGEIRLIQLACLSPVIIWAASLLRSYSLANHQPAQHGNTCVKRRHRKTGRDQKKHDGWIRNIPDELPQVCVAQGWKMDGANVTRLGPGDVDRGGRRETDRKRHEDEKKCVSPHLFDIQEFKK